MKWTSDLARLIGGLAPPLKMEDKDYVNFGDVARGRLHQQCQYASRYINGEIEGYPNLGEGLRFKGNPLTDYHSVLIHKDDVEEFIARYEDHKRNITNRFSING